MEPAVLGLFSFHQQVVAKLNPVIRQDLGDPKRVLSQGLGQETGGGFCLRLLSSSST
jgi:hypothetical protein